MGSVGFAVFLVSIEWRVWVRVADGCLYRGFCCSSQEGNRCGTSIVGVTRIVLANRVFPGPSGLMGRLDGLLEHWVSRLKQPWQFGDAAILTGKAIFRICQRFAAPSRP